MIVCRYQWCICSHFFFKLRLCIFRPSGWFLPLSKCGIVVRTETVAFSYMLCARIIGLSPSVVLHIIVLMNTRLLSISCSRCFSVQCFFHVIWYDHFSNNSLPSMLSPFGASECSLSTSPSLEGDLTSLWGQWGQTTGMSLKITAPKSFAFLFFICYPSTMDPSVVWLGGGWLNLDSVAVLILGFTVWQLWLSCWRLS